MNKIEIDKIKSFNELIDLFYDQINEKTPEESLPTCVKIVNRIKNMKTDYNEEELLMFNELRNVYIFLLNDYNKGLLQAKYKNDLDFSIEEINSRVGLGFSIIADNYDKEVKRFIARTMINDMLYDTFPNHKFDIEKDFHLQFSKNKIIENGINRSFIDIVKKYDADLSNYIISNASILKEFNEYFNNIIDNYDDYEEKSEKNRYNYIVEDVKDYCKEYGLDEEEELFRISAELEILNKLINYSDEYNYSDYARIIEIAVSASRNDKEFNYINIRRIIEKYLNERVVTEKLTNTKKDYEIELDNLYSNYNSLSEKERKKILSDILGKVKTNEELDKLTNYFNVINNRKTNIMLFKKNNESN